MKISNNIILKIVSYCLICFILFPLSSPFVLASSKASIYINQRKTVTIDGKTEKLFTITLKDELFYVVETKGDVDTVLRVKGLSNGELFNDDSGTDRNACIGFKGEKTTIVIYVRGFSQDSVGTTVLQIRKQQAAMFGFSYPENENGEDIVKGLNTIPDLEKPENALRPMYSVTKYTSSSTSANVMKNNDNRGIPVYNSEVLFFSGHGYYSSSGDGKTYGFGVSFPVGGFYISDIIDMSNTKIVVWAACYSANQNNAYHSSMAHKSVEKGAKSAIGWEEVTADTSSRKFTDAFFKAIAEGKTVKQAAEKGKSVVVWPWDSVRRYTLVGNNNTLVNSPYANRKDSSNVFLLNEFLERYNEKNWIKIECGEGKTRYYQMVKGCLSNDYYEIEHDEEGNIVDIFHSGIYINQQKVLDNKFGCGYSALKNYCSGSVLDYRAYNVFVLISENVVPVRIEYVTIAEDETVKVDVICTNLNDGTIIDYSDIC